MSRRPGIGAGYLPTGLQYNVTAMRGFINKEGRKLGLPRYYRDRLFDTDQKKIINEQTQNLIAEKNRDFIDYLLREGGFDNALEAHYYTVQLHKHDERLLFRDINRTDKM